MGKVEQGQRNEMNSYSTPPRLFVAVPFYTRHMACVVMHI